LLSAIPKYEGNFLLLNQGMATLRIPYNPTSSNPGQPIAIQYFQMAIGMMYLNLQLFRKTQMCAFFPG